MRKVLLIIKNFYLTLKDQGPPKRAFHNFFITGNAWGLFSRYSHYTKNNTPKVGYNTKESAMQASHKMKLKNGFHYSVYRCLYCGKFHLGRNRTNYENRI